MWLRVHLRPDACFSDGVPVTAEDVRWTIQDFIFNERIEAERSRSILDMIEDVEVLDDHALEITFNKALFSNLTGGLERRGSAQALLFEVRRVIHQPVDGAPHGVWLVQAGIKRPG